MKTLIIDDEISSLYSFLDKLIAETNIDYHFMKDDPDIILSYLRDTEVDGIFLDIKMPNINGLDLAKKIITNKTLSNRIPKFVFVTGLNIRFSDLDEIIQNHCLGIVYKPVNKEEIIRYLHLIKEDTITLHVMMFSHFDCFINSKLIHFSSKKSKELFALLLAFRNKSLSMETAITYLWPDKDVEHAKILYRDAVWRLRQTLDEVNFPCVTFSRALMSLNTKNIECDYYDYLDGKKQADILDFLVEYEWPIEHQAKFMK